VSLLGSHVGGKQKGKEKKAYIFIKLRNKWPGFFNKQRLKTVTEIRVKKYIYICCEREYTAILTMI